MKHSIRSRVLALIHDNLWWFIMPNIHTHDKKVCIDVVRTLNTITFREFNSRMIICNETEALGFSVGSPFTAG